jgi:hypothetical protein
VPAKGSKEVTPSATTTYVLTADSGSEKVTKSVTVTVDVPTSTKAATSTAAPVVNSFTSTKNSLTLGDNLTLNWAVTGARAVTIKPGVGSVPTTGSILVTPVGNTTYTLLATNSFGTENATVAVTVNTTTDYEAPVIRSFVAQPSTISPGQTSNLSWDIKGATVIVIDQGIGTPNSFYSQDVSPSETTTYTLTAINSSATASATVTVTVQQ